MQIDAIYHASTYFRYTLDSYFSYLLDRALLPRVLELQLHCRTLFSSFFSLSSAILCLLAISISSYHHSSSAVSSSTSILAPASSLCHPARMSTMNDDRPLQNTTDHHDPPLEKDFSNGYGHGNMNNNNMTMGSEESNGAALNRIRTAGSVSISPELFEKLYLSPENRVKGDLRKTFGNPTPM